MTSPFNPNLAPNLPPRGPNRIVYLEANRPPTILDTKYRDGSYYEFNTEWRDTSKSPADIYKLTNIFSKTNANWLLLGGNVPSIEKFIPDTGTSPVLGPTTTITNTSILATGTLPNALRSNGLNVNSLAYQTQFAGSNAGSSTANNFGVSQYDSNQFSVTSGFVQLKGGTTPAILTISDDANTKVQPDGTGNIQLVGHVNNSGTAFKTIVANASSHLHNINPMSSARWIVDPLGFNGTHTTISAAITDAGSGDLIILLPGTYTEDLTITKNLGFATFYENTRGAGYLVTVIGKVTIATNSLSVNFSGIKFQTNSDVILNLTGLSTNINYYGCSFAIINNNGMTINAPSTGNVYLRNCYGAIRDNFNLATCTGGILWIINCFLEESATAPTATSTSTDRIVIYNSRITIPFSTSSTGTIEAENTVFGVIPTPFSNQTYLTTSGSGTSTLFNCEIYSGSASAISIGANTTVELNNCSINSSNTNAVTGAGTVKMNAITFNGSSSLNNTTTQISNPLSFPKAGGTGSVTSTNLSYYEEGTWTPTLTGASTSGTTTYTVQVGVYTRIGRLITIHGRIAISAATGTGSALIGGLPYTINSTTNLSLLGSIILSSASNSFTSANCTNYNCSGIVNTTTLNIIGFGNTSSGTAVSSMANASCDFRFSLTYIV